MIDVFLYWLTDFIRFCLDYDFHGVRSVIDPVVGGAIVTGVGSFLKSIFGRKTQSDTNRTNLQIARETNENQYRMFTEGNQFSERMANEAWNRETAYNDPRAQMLRYQRAGINPQVAMSGSLGSAATQPGDMSAPTSLAPPVQHAPTVQPLPHVLSGLEEMSRVVGNLISAKKDNADANRTAGLYTAELENILEDTQSKRLQNAYQYMENLIKGKTGMKKALLDMREQMSRIVLNDKMTETEKYKQVNLVADTFLKKAEKKLTQAKTTELNETLPLIKRSYEEQIKLTKKQQATEDSKQAANYASANDSNASADLKREQKRTEHWNKVAASWNALDSKTRATLNKKYGNAERLQGLIDKKIDEFVKANSVANPSDMINKGHQLFDNLVDALNLDYSGSRKNVTRKIRQYVLDRLAEEYGF